MNNDENKAPFDITQYQKLKRLDKDGEEREYYIIPDDIFDEYLKELPPGTYNKSMTYRAYNGGKLYQLNQDPEEAATRGRAGGIASQSTQQARRSFKEEADILLARVDKNTGKTGIENITVAMYERALAGDVKAYTALRDTAGEKPADTVDLNANVMTEADQALIEKLKNRTGVE